MGNVGDGPELEPLGQVAAHSQGIGIVETQGARDFQPLLRQCRFDVGRGAGLAALENFQRKRTGVLAVSVDVALEERGKGDLRAAQLVLVLDPGAAVRSELREHLAENHALGE